MEEGVISFNYIRIIGNRNRMSESAVLALPNSYEPYQIVLLSLATLYAALFVKISNHYVFKPKIQRLFQESTICSTALYQFLVDFLTNLTHLTFILTSLLLLSDDNSLSVMIYSDISWSGIMMCVIAFKGLAPKEEPNYQLLFLKNVVFLGLIYTVIVSHYASEKYLISLGIGMMVLYSVNLLLNGYEDKFVGAMEVLFGYKPTGEVEEDYEHHNNMVSLEYLSQRFRVTKTDIQEHMRSHHARLKAINLKTRRLIVQNMLKISLAVHLSKQKMEAKAKRDVKYYFGAFNGTVIDKSKKMILEKPGSKEEGSHLELTEQHTQEDYESHNSAIFYIFPVKFLEGNQAISIVFSGAINLGLGILLSITLKMIDTIPYGQFFQIVFGVLLLPVLPNISKEQFLNSMALSSLWKYCLYGIFLTIVCLTSTTTDSFSFAQNAQLVFAPIIQLASLAFTSSFVFSRTSSPYTFSFVWLAATIASGVLIFKYC